MTEIKLEKRFPHIPSEDVITIFQEGYLKGWENARRKSIPISWLISKSKELVLTKGSKFYSILDLPIVYDLIEEWKKENESY